MEAGSSSQNRAHRQPDKVSVHVPTIHHDEIVSAAAVAAASSVLATFIRYRTSVHTQHS